MTLREWADIFPLAKEVLTSSRAMTPQEEKADRERQVQEHLKGVSQSSIGRGTALDTSDREVLAGWVNESHLVSRGGQIICQSDVLQH